MPKYKVLEPLSHDGTRYEPGSEVEMTEKQAKPLIEIYQAIAPLPPDETTKGGKTKAEKVSDPSEKPDP